MNSMTDQIVIQKMIYFPAGGEPGMKKGYPEIVYVSDRWNDQGRSYLTATLKKSDAIAGRGGLLNTKRAIPYSDDVWQICRDYRRRRETIENEYKQLMKAAGKAAKRGD